MSNLSGISTNKDDDQGILWAVATSHIQIERRYQNGLPHHITLQHGVRREDWQNLIGLPLTAAAIALCHNDRIEALEVVLPAWVKCQNPHPHITVSWIDGVEPVEANAMLAGPHERSPLFFPVHCLIGFQEWINDDNG